MRKTQRRLWACRHHARRASGRRSFFLECTGSSRSLLPKITTLTWTADGLLRHTVYVGLREDKPGRPGAASQQASVEIGLQAPLFY